MIISEGFCVYLIQIRKKIFAEMFIVFVKGFQDYQAWNNDEQIGLDPFHHYFELLMFLGHGLDGS